MVVVAGMIIGLALVRLAGSRQPWLRAAILAQTADLVTFAVIWEHGEHELNPLGGLAKEASLALFYPALEINTAFGVASLTAALVLMSLKLALIGYVIRASPYLGRYRGTVLGAAIGAGILGAGSNLLAYPNAAVPLLIVAVFALIAVRWPMRFGDAVGASTRLVVTGCFVLATFAAFAYVPYAEAGFLCYPDQCPSVLGTFLMMLALVFSVIAVISVWITLRFAARFLPDRPERRSFD